MSRHRRSQVHHAVEEIGVVPLYYHSDAAVAVDIAAACAAGGARVVEFTNRGDRAISVFQALTERLGESEPGLMLGVGSVVDAATAALFIAAGAEFVVSPYFVGAVARLCHSRRVAYVPGAATPWEVAQAEASGAELVKLFPASILGPDFVRHHLGPSPDSRLIPTGGIAATEEAVTAWIRAGAAAIGLGSQVIPSRSVAPADVDRLPERLRTIRGWVAAARAGM